MNHLLICFDVDNWCYHSRARSLQRHAPRDFTVTIRKWTDRPLPQHDLLFQLDSSQTRRFSDRPFVLSWNSDKNRRADRWAKAYQSCDWLLHNNRECWESHGPASRTCAISNGVETDIFKPIVPIEDREHRVFWTGSSSPEKQKGWDILKAARPELERLGFICDFHPVESAATKPFSESQMVERYNAASYACCVSQSDSTPNTTLEGMACGCALVSTKVGNICEMGIPNENYVPIQRNVLSLITGLEEAREKRERLSAAARETMLLWAYGSPGYRADAYFHLFRELCAGRTPDPFSHDRMPVAACDGGINA